jgi:tRNA A37 threonylcarbamoyltransferase TsaD
MLKISKSLGSSQVKTYYEKEYLAKESYWQQDDTAPGEWHGKLAAEMGLSGAIDFEVFARLADGKQSRLSTGQDGMRHSPPQNLSLSQLWSAAMTAFVRLTTTPSM